MLLTESWRILCASQTISFKIPGGAVLHLYFTSGGIFFVEDDSAEVLHL